MVVNVSIVYPINLAPEHRNVHIEDLELSMLDPAVLAQIVTPAVIYCDVNCRAKVLKHPALAGILYSDLGEAFCIVDDSFNPPTPDDYGTRIRT